MTVTRSVLQVGGAELGVGVQSFTPALLAMSEPLTDTRPDLVAPGGVGDGDGCHGGARVGVEPAVLAGDDGAAEGGGASAGRRGET